jgi:oxygen-independent coproporphyrinogen-3 oxidase
VIVLKISIQGLEDERFYRQLQLIANLFFEESQIFSMQAEADLLIKFHLQVKESVAVSAELVDNMGKTNRAVFEKELVPSDSEKEFFKQIKNAVSHVYLTVLQDWTGIKQKWGILTGVRPTKLLHRKVQEGIPTEIAHQQLKDDYLITDEKIMLMQQIVERQLTVVPDLYTLQKDDIMI